MTALQDAEREIDARLDDIATFLDSEAGTAGQSRGAPGREILIVEDAVYYSAGYRAQGPGTRISAQAYVLLTGRPSPSSTVTRGIIRFVEASAIRVPIWRDATTTIETWIDMRYMAQTLEQLRHSTRYFWRGEFPSGHIYSDLHSRP
jgi:hypothetical protein